MSAKWYYKMFGQDFGPVTFDELKVLAEFGTIATDDEVRREDSDNWMPVSSVAGLSEDAAAAVTVSTSTATAEKEPAVAAISTGADDWFCMLHGLEMGPLTFDDLLEFASQGQVGADDEVKLGATGKWRRVGSIGRLVAVLPYQDPAVVKAQPVAPAPKPVAASQPVAPQAAPAAAKPAVAAQQAPQPARPAAVAQAAPAPLPVAPAPQPVAPPAPAILEEELALIKAQAAFEATEQAARQLVAWAFSPNCHAQWWGVMSGAENGPVDFKQILDWAVSGRMQPTDYVRNGIFGQYGPAGNLPGLFSAAAILKQATDAYQAAKTRAAQATAGRPTPAPVAVAPAPAPVAVQPVAASVPQQPGRPTPQSNPSVATVEPRPVQSPAASGAVANPTRTSNPSISTPAMSAPAPRPASPPPSSGGGFSSPMGSSSPSMSRPMPVPARPAPRQSSGSSVAIGDLFKGPVGMGLLGVAAVALLVVGWSYMPKGSGADIQRYQELKKVLSEVRAKRSAKSSDFAEIKSKATKMSKEYTPILKKEATADYPAKQNLLWAARDDLPQMMNGDLTVESSHEKNFAAHLDKVAQVLKIKAD